MYLEIPIPRGPEGADPTKPKKWRQVGVGFVGGVAATTLLATAVGLALTNTDTQNAANCPRRPGLTVVTPDMVAHKQGGWANYQGEVCVQGISRVITGPSEPIIEVINPSNGTLQPEIVFPETLVGKHAAVTIYTDTRLGPSAGGDALIGDPYIGGPKTSTYPNLLVFDKIEPSQS